MTSTVVSRVLLSGSTNGRPIAIAATATPGTLLHTVSGDTDVLGAVTLWATNTTAAQVTLTLELGGTSASDNISLKIAANTTTKVLDGATFDGAVVLRAFAGSTPAINIFGFENRLSSN